MECWGSYFGRAGIEGPEFGGAEIRAGSIVSPRIGRFGMGGVGSTLVGRAVQDRSPNGEAQIDH